MSEFIVTKKVFVKSKNNIYKINARYTYSILAITILTILINFLFNYKNYAITLLKYCLVSLIFTTILTYIKNIIKKDYNIKNIFINDNPIVISLILGLFSINLPIYILLIANIISVFIKLIYKKINTSASLYGLLLIIISTQFLDNLSTIEHITYLESILSILSFIYLFSKKSIKYSLVISYILTIFSILFLYTIFSNSSALFLLDKLTTNQLLLLSIFALSDYQITPTISRAGIIFGTIIGLITTILIFIYPSISVVIPMLLGHLALTNILEHITPKLKYNNKVYYLIFISCIFLIIITIIILLLVTK